MRNLPLLASLSTTRSPHMTASTPTLWKATQVQWEASCMRKFQKLARDRYHLDLNTYDDLHRFSVEDLRFYELLWDYVGLRFSRKYDRIISNPKAMPSDCPTFYNGALLNYAENCLHPIHPANGTGCSPATPHSWPGRDTTAIIEVPEGGGLHDSPTALQAQHVSWGALRNRVAIVAAALRRKGVVKGDRIAHVAANTTRPIVTFLAAASIGAIFSALPTDAGVDAIYGRLSQIQPKLLFSDDAAIYNGKEVDVIARVSQATDRLVQRGDVGSEFEVITSHNARVSKTYAWSGKLAKQSVRNTSMPQWLASVDLADGAVPPPLVFEQLPFSHPALIVFSSGTTGEPKCITHSLGGMLITQKKECLLHYDMKPSDIFLQITTTGWIMWLIALSAPLCGSTIIAYDGSPLSPSASHILKVLAAHKATGFGCSPRFLSEVERAGLCPRHDLDMSNLRLVTSTGSPLSARNAKFFYDSFAQPHTQLMSISGGTDIAGTFVCGAPQVPVRGHLIGCKTLGMDVRILDALTGEDCEESGEPGELVCARPFLTQPLMFWGPPEKRAELDAKYRDSYYSRFSEAGKGVWAQGDFISRHSGALEIHGRSDGVLNPSGVRFGSAEIYAVVDKFEWALDSICVGQRRPGRDEDERVLLFIKPRNPASPPTPSDLDDLRRAIRIAYSARHVPAHVLLVSDIPVTANGKKTELAIKAIVCGDTRFKASSAIANPQALDEYRQFLEIENVTQRPTKAKL